MRTAVTPFAVAALVLHASCGGQSFGGPATGDGGAEADGCQGAACTTDSGGACRCAGPAPSTPNYVCTDGTTGGPFCNTHPDGSCDWANRSCTPGCPGLGCDPACPNGVLKDANGCDTCTCAPAADGGRAGAPCMTSADCGGLYVCGFPEAAACAATGTCFAAEQVVCNAASPGCGCDGATYNIVCNGLPSGYAPAPLLHTGACATTAFDAGNGDGGACCPVGWDLYSCSDPDGGSGMACHNPQLGCASSTTCGQGCDHVVTGRCP